MDTITRQALGKLLRKAERRMVKGGSGPIPSLKFSAASLPAYNESLTRERLSLIHAELRECLRAGAIEIDWDSRAGDDGQIARIRLIDAVQLAEFLDKKPRWEVIAESEVRVAPWRGRWRVEEVWARWQQDQPVRGFKPDRADLLVDACRVLDCLSENQDVPVRRLSASLFQDSKRIERDLVAMLDELTRSSDLLASDKHLVLQRLGLVKHPQPVLIAGRHQIRLKNERTVALHEPYIGLAPDHVCGIADEAPAHIMTIENLTTFNEVARGLNDEVDALVIYTGGMPSPALRAALRALIADCAERTCFWHWGDIDVGGLRTALAIQGELDGRTRLRPWQMDLSMLPSDTRLTDAPDNVVKQMITLAERLDWPEEAAGIRRLRAIVEQEVLAPCRPF